VKRTSAIARVDNSRATRRSSRIFTPDEKEKERQRERERESLVVIVRSCSRAPRAHFGRSDGSRGEFSAGERYRKNVHFAGTYIIQCAPRESVTRLIRGGSTFLCNLLQGAVICPRHPARRCSHIRGCRSRQSPSSISRAAVILIDETEKQAFLEPYFRRKSGIN